MTIETPFDPDGLRKLLMGLTAQQRLVFSLACSERLYPSYVVFASEQRWGEPEALRTALDLVWDAVLGQPSSPQAVHRLMKRVEDAEPDTEEFETILVSPALDAAATAGLALKMLDTNDPDFAVEIASLSRDSVDMYVQALDRLDPSDTALEKKILLHPLMQAELRRQGDDLRMLAGAAWTPAEARRLKDIWRDPAVSNINIGLYEKSGTR